MPVKEKTPEFCGVVSILRRLEIHSATALATGRRVTMQWT